MKCNKENMKLLISELRSGEHKQGKDCLRNSNGEMCCLGVAENIRLSQLGLEWGSGFYDEDGGYFILEIPDVIGEYDDTAKYLSPKGSEWLGLDDDGTGYDPWLKIPKHLHHKRSDPTRASELNDEYGFTFEEIADCFEHTFWGD